MKRGEGEEKGGDVARLAARDILRAKNLLSSREQNSTLLRAVDGAKEGIAGTHTLALCVDDDIEGST